MTPAQLKKALIASGFEVFRTLAEEVVLAERVRENLILDSGIRVKPLEGERYEVRLVLRAERRDFPNDDDTQLFGRVRTLAEPALELGYEEGGSLATPMKDPSDPNHVLDTFYEVFFSKRVDDYDTAVQEVRSTLPLSKVVGNERD